LQLAVKLCVSRPNVTAVSVTIAPSAGPAVVTDQGGMLPIGSMDATADWASAPVVPDSTSGSGWQAPAQPVLNPDRPIGSSLVWARRHGTGILDGTAR
jgi:hypothetical protein